MRALKKRKRGWLKRIWKVGMVGVLAGTLVAGCGNTTIGEGPRNPVATDGVREFAVDQQTLNLPLVTHGQGKYVALQALIEGLGFQSAWNQEHTLYSFGDHDPEYQLEVGSDRAVQGDEVMHLSGVPIWIKDAVYLPLSAIPQLFRRDISYQTSDDQIQILPYPNSPVDPGEGLTDETALGDLDFAEAPEGAEDSGDTIEETPLNGGEGDFMANAISAQAAKVNGAELIRVAQKYKGVKYQFGTGSYSNTGKFDCSSFTQFLFRKMGVSLPRTARAQANRGKSVSRKQLKKGDLLFFYVPGRFKSNQTVGHVGIYMGGMQMIHSSPEPKNGVQISNINKAHWKKTFLKAKRITA